MVVEAKAVTATVWRPEWLLGMPQCSLGRLAPHGDQETIDDCRRHVHLLLIPALPSNLQQNA